MQVYKFFRHQKNNASPLISPAIGALIQHHPIFIINFPRGRSQLNTQIWEIFTTSEIAFDKFTESKKIKKISSEEATLLLKQPDIHQPLGFNIETTQKTALETMENVLNKGILLQATVSDVALIFGHTAGKYWQFHPLLSNDSSGLTVYDNLNEFKEALRKLQKPEFILLKTQELSQTIENKAIKASL